MANILTLLIIGAIGYWVMIIIERKKRELEEKELLQKEQFIKETQSLLKMEVPLVVSPAQEPVVQPTINTTFRQKVIDSFSEQGYSMSESPKAEGIDLLGVKEKELLLIRCDNALKEVKKIDLQLFIAECSLYIDHNPMLKSRTLIRLYATDRPITDEAQHFVRENPASLRLIEEI